MSDLFSTVFAEGSPIKNVDKVLVVMVTGLSNVLGNLELEMMVGAILLGFAGIMLGAGFLGCCGGRSTGSKSSKGRVISLIMTLIFVGSSLWCSLNLKLPRVNQDPTRYGSLAVQSMADLPTFPSIGDRLECAGEWFKDSKGRVVMLRGVNLGGDTKVPAKPDGATWISKGFRNYKGVSFVGRPFQLERADEHLGRLRSWGFTFFRFLITWEAIEHDGPGVYDTEYVAYIREVIIKCREHGISVFIDPHQDVWSRWTGGDGAPAWTLEKVGFDLKGLYESGAAITHQEHGDPFPQMVWPTNYNRLAAATMFTLFFAGDTYAPNTLVDGMPAQEFLQSHYLNAVKQIAAAVKDLPNVVGYDTLNEPSTGYATLPDLNTALFAAPLGTFVSGFQGMQLGAGLTLDVPVFSKPLILSRVDKVNPKGVLAWKSHAHDIWRNEGVWELSKDGKGAKLLRPDHFALNKGGDNANFMRDFMAPFFERYKKELHAVHPDAIIFAEPYIDPNRPSHDSAPMAVSGDRYAWAPHYYDAMTLLLKTMRPWFALDITTTLPVLGTGATQNAITSNLLHVKNTAKSLGGKKNGGPVLVGEIGISMDLDRDKHGRAKAYKTGDYSAQILALDRTMRGLESNLLSFTLWNYSPENSNKRGDLWNDEDLSLWSKDQQHVPMSKDINSGGRALAAAVRPYPMMTCGNPLELVFDPLRKDRSFRFVFENSASCKDTPTIIYVPHYQYPHGVQITVSDGSFTHYQKNQYVSYVHDSKQTLHTVEIKHLNENVGASS